MNETELFDNWAATYDRAVSGNSTLYGRYDEVLDAVAEAADVDSGKTVLDIGTGTGNLALSCLARGAAVVGIDPSAGMLGKAREKAGSATSIEWLQVSDPFLSIPFPDGRFDAAVSSYAFHHIPHERKPAAIEEMLRVLRSGGTWAMGDLMFANPAALAQALQEYDWLEEEHFAFVEDMRGVLSGFGIELRCTQFTPVTWVLSARKP